MLWVSPRQDMLILFYSYIIGYIYGKTTPSPLLAFPSMQNGVQSAVVKGPFSVLWPFFPWSSELTHLTSNLGKSNLRRFCSDLSCSLWERAACRERDSTRWASAWCSPTLSSTLQPSIYQQWRLLSYLISQTSQNLGVEREEECHLLCFFRSLKMSMSLFLVNQKHPPSTKS